MSDVLNPADKNKLAKERKIPLIGKEGSQPPVMPSAAPAPAPEPIPSEPEIEVPTGQPMPVPEEVPMEQPMGQPIPAPATSETGQPVEEYGQQVFTPEMNPQNIRYSPIETPLPSFNGIDALQEATSTPSVVQAEVAEMQQQLSPDSIRSVMGMVRPQPIEWSGKYESDSQTVRDNLIQLQYQNQKLVEQNDLGLQNAQFTNTGEKQSSVSAVDNGVAARGLLSGIGKNLQDLDPEGKENNTANRILGWLDRAGRSAGYALEYGLSATDQLVKLNPFIGKKDKERILKRGEDYRSKKLEQLTGADLGNFGIQNLASTESQGDGYQMNPMKGQWGDYGDHPVLSPILYAANLPQAVLNGLIYDAADLIHGDTGKSDKQRSRTLQALQGRDYGASNRWTENKYLSLQEPESFVSGKRAADDSKYRDNPMAKYWDFPEWFEKTPVGQVTPGNAKTNHLLFQTLPAMAAEVITGGFSDWGLSSIVTTARNAVTKKAASEAAQKLIPEAGGALARVDKPGAVTVPSESYVPFYETKPVTTRIRTQQPAILDPMGQVMSRKKLPDGRRLSSRITENTPLSDEALTLNVRSNSELSTIARNTINPVSGKPILQTDRVLSDIEVAKLNRQFGNLFDRYGETIPDIEGSKYIEGSDGSLSEIIQPTITVDTIIPTTAPDVAKVLQEVDDLGGQLRYALETGNGNADAILERIIRADDKVTKAVAALPEEQLYISYTNKLPDSLVTDNQAGQMVGNELVKHQHMLEAQRPVIDQLTEEVDNLKARVNETMEELDSLPDFRRGNIDDSLNTKALYEPENVPEIRVEPYQPKLIPAIEELPVRARGLDNTLDETPLWLHGSSSPVGIRERDILNGATPSEFGLGTYLTTNQDVADQAAYALRQNNRPPRPDSVDGAPYRTTVDTSRMSKVLQLNEPPAMDVQNIFAQARKSMGVDQFDNTSKRVADMWNQFDVDYAAKFGGKVPESVKREFQQKVLVNLQTFGYDGGVFYKNYKKLDNAPATSDAVASRIAQAIIEQGGDYVPIHKLRPLLGDVSREEFDKGLYKLIGDDSIEYSTMAEVKAYTPDEIEAGIPQPVGGGIHFFTDNKNGKLQEWASRPVGNTKKQTQDLTDAVLVNYQPHKLGVVGANVPLDTPGITKQLEARKWLDQKTFETLPNDVTRSYHLQSRLQFESKVLQDTSEALVQEQFKQGELIENLAKLEDELEGITYRQKEDLLRAEPEQPKLNVQKTLRENESPCIPTKMSRSMRGTLKVLENYT